MNTKIRTLVLIAFVSVSLHMVSCKDKAEQNDKTRTEQTTTEQSETVSKQGKEYTSAYVCPMHCEGSGSDEEGSCPKCGMAYVQNDEHMKDGHKH